MSSPVCSQDSRELQRHWTAAGGQTTLQTAIAGAHPWCETQPGDSVQQLRGVWNIRAKKTAADSKQEPRRLLNCIRQGSNLKPSVPKTDALSN